MYQRMRTLAVSALEHLAARAPELDEELQEDASALIARRGFSGGKVRELVRELCG